MIPVNYLAIFAAALAQMVVGFLWYGPLFGKTWSDMMGYKFDTQEEKKEMQKKAMPSYAISFVAAIVMAYVLATALEFGNAYLGTQGATSGLTAAFWYWLGFVVPVTLGTILWENKRKKLWLINASYWLVGMLVMGTILAIWQ